MIHRDHIQELTKPSTVLERLETKEMLWQAALCIWCGVVMVVWCGNEETAFVISLCLVILYMVMIHIGLIQTLFPAYMQGK